MYGLPMNANAALTGKPARRALAALADIAVPPICCHCRSATSDNHAVCGACWAQMSFIEPPYCAVLGSPFSHDLGDDMVSADAIADPPPFSRLRSAVAHDAVARTLVHRLKFGDRPDFARFMATLMCRAGRALLEPDRVIIPVPLYRWRLWQRRFNQAAELGAALSTQSGLDHDPLALRRIRSTKKQVGLSARQRADNVRGAFRVDAAARIRIAGRKVLLVDDVYTSGATIKAATRALVRAGAADVAALTFTRAVRQ